MTILLALFILLAVSGVVYALGRSSGFMKPVADIASRSAMQTVTATQEAYPTETAAPVTGTPTTVTDNPLVITQFTDTGDSYVLAGELDPPAPSQSAEWYIEPMSDLDIVDGNGQEVYWHPAYLLSTGKSFFPVTRFRKDVWEIVIPKVYKAKNQSQSYIVALPLHITETIRYAVRADSQETYEFEFHAGDDPSHGQEWDQEWNLNKLFQLAGYPIRLKTIRVNPYGEWPGYDFIFSHDTSVNGLSVSIEGYPPIGNEFSGVIDPSGTGQSLFHLTYSDIPKGKLKVILSDLYLNGETKSWSVDLQL
jgi:hypothetical protein